MTAAFARTDTSLLGRWWWTVDRWTLAALALLIGAGAVLMFAASPPAAARINLESYHFVRQQLILLPVAFIVMIAVSLASPKTVRRGALALFLVALIGTVVVAFAGSEIKGARRWLEIAGYTIQPSEFLKPAFAVMAAWLFALARTEEGFRGNLIATLLAALTIGALVLQPDVGMAAIVFAVWFAEFFLAGMPVLWIGLAIGGSVIGTFTAYHALPHVAARIDAFLDPGSADTYQIDRSMEAFQHGGLLGTGPGEGTIKALLPDAHSDFIFSVAGEEFGLIFCLVMVLTYTFVVLRGFGRALVDTNIFVLYATTGLLVAFGLQALINMASALRLIPTKGMTLPFVSYGGSSLLALAIGMGMVLALTRKRAGVTRA